MNTTKRKRRLGRPPLPQDQRMRRRPIGMLESDWQIVKAIADADEVSVDEIIRRLVRATAQKGEK